ncbi:related to isotrichodermin C-15 hydroxylase (cytochrome P-450 monooxygenase CYP65A1) [Lecanosticta acicola]|uniref:Related to isotrichodermin C-15 hydroxylase (Cytochrome P-450 monooxygenase CYP65A1) n=1 Tax=Lecanosticta acicola TaxID=111012 RepID=A0AAI8Z7N8_9PEZI|nr:related to isotrichodermin C-15 hydroxylase (cytochrome P-450 monooxygenase CYP65A1) [Lecanosticta acicola]
MAYSWWQMLAVSFIATTLLQRIAPEYSLGSIATVSILFASQLLLLQFYRIVLYQRFFSPLRHIPQAPGGHFFTGQTQKIIKEPSGYPMREWAENVSNNGLIRYSFLFTERLLVTSTAALSEVLVTKNYDFVKPPQVRHGLGRILGVGILLAEGDEHKTQRKNLMPAFAFRHIKDIYPTFWKKSQEMVECLAEAAKSDVLQSEKERSVPEAGEAEEKHEPGTVNVGNWTSRATLDIIGLSGMGQDFDSLHNPDNKLNAYYKTVFSAGGPRARLQMLALILPFWLVSRIPSKRNREIIEASGYIKKVCRDLIAKKREAMNSEKGRTEVDILSVALESGGFTDEDLVNQMMTFLVAGHETTATSMIWAIYELCRHREIQQKLREEVRAKIPSLDSDITAAQIDDLHYLQAFCNEVLRLWAPVGLTLRHAAVDTSIQGEYIPKGTLVVMSPRATNCSTELWGDDAREFRPERWLNEDGKANAKGGADSNYAFMTFLHGPRSCIGQKFAQAEFACLLAAWVGRYESEFEPGSAISRGEFEIQGGVTSKPKGGLWCKLREVPGW